MNLHTKKRAIDGTDRTTKIKKQRRHAICWQENSDELNNLQDNIFTFQLDQLGINSQVTIDNNESNNEEDDLTDDSESGVISDENITSQEELTTVKPTVDLNSNTSPEAPFCNVPEFNNEDKSASIVIIAESKEF